MAIMVVASSFVHIVLAIVGVFVFFVNSVAIMVSSSVIFINGLLIMGVVHHRREFLIIWLWFYGILFFLGTIMGFPQFPVIVAVITGFSMIFVYALLRSFDHFPRFHANLRRMDPPRTPMYMPQPNPRPVNNNNELLTENELVTISATIAAHDLLLQQRHAAVRATINPDAGLPTYDEIMKIVQEEEKNERSEKETLRRMEENRAEEVSFEEEVLQSPPPAYGEALRLMRISEGLPNVVQ
jgi:hypothetical protein